MSYLFEGNGVQVRTALSYDLSHFRRWLRNPLVLEWFEGRDQFFSDERIRAEFIDPADETTRCIVEHGGRPIGFAQLSDLLAEEKEAFGYEPDRKIFGIDQFIGEPELWNQGIGTTLVNAMVSYLCTTFHPELIVLDPQVRNPRAIHTYTKCGFKAARTLKASEFHEGIWEDCLLMERKCDS